LQIHLFVSTESTNVTDSQTDTARQHRLHLCIASCSNYLKIVVTFEIVLEFYF